MQSRLAKLGMVEGDEGSACRCFHCELGPHDLALVQVARASPDSGYGKYSEIGMQALERQFAVYSEEGVGRSVVVAAEADDGQFLMADQRGDQACRVGDDSQRFS